MEARISTKKFTHHLFFFLVMKRQYPCLRPPLFPNFSSIFAKSTDSRIHCRNLKMPQSIKDHSRVRRGESTLDWNFQTIQSGSWSLWPENSLVKIFAPTSPTRYFPKCVRNMTLAHKLLYEYSKILNQIFPNLQEWWTLLRITSENFFKFFPSSFHYETRISKVKNQTSTCYFRLEASKKIYIIVNLLLWHILA